MWKKLPAQVRSIAIFSLMILVSISLFFIGIWRMRNAYQDAYEKQNHVPNYAVISIKGLQEVSRLEVLSATGSEFIIKNADEEDKTVSWLEVQGRGVFTVDLSIGEYIVGKGRQSVLIKVPKPVLTECAMTGTGKRFWYNGGFFKTNLRAVLQMVSNYLRNR